MDTMIKLTGFKRYFLAIEKYLVVILSFLLIGVLFTQVASYDYNGDYSFSEPISIPANIIDFVEASIEGLGTYKIADFELRNYHTIDDIKELNFVKYFILDEFDGYMIVQRIMIYLTTAILLAMIVLPLICGIRTIIDIAKKRTNQSAKKTLVLLLILSLLLFLTLPMIGYSVMEGIFFYQGLIFIGLLYFYLQDLVTIRRIFLFKEFVFRFLTYSSLLAVVYLSSVNMIHFTSLVEQYSQYEESSNFGDLVTIINYFGRTQSYLVSDFSVYALRYLHNYYDWIPYHSLLVSLFMIASLVLVIIAIIADTLRNSELKILKIHTSRLILIAFILQIINLVSMIILEVSFNDNYYFQIRMTYDYIYYSVFTVLTGILYQIKKNVLLDEVTFYL